MDTLSQQLESLGVDILHQSDGTTAVIRLPGILSDCHHFDPVANQFPSGLDIGVDSLTFEEISNVIYLLRQSGYHKVIPIGSSMGGMRLAFIIELLRQNHPEVMNDTDWLELIIIDSPTGVETMKDLPDAVARLVPVKRISLPICSIAMRLIVKPPRRGDIQVPGHELMRQLAGVDMTDDDWRTYVRVKSILIAQEYTGSQLQEWVDWMVQVGRDGSLKRAATSLRGIKSTYICCNSKELNTTVKQPRAAKWWESYAGVTVTEIAAAHCGLLQMPETFNQVMSEALA